MKPIRHKGNKPSTPASALKLAQKGRLSFHSFLLVFALFSAVAVSGCIGQATGTAGTGGISIRALADPASIRSNEAATLFVDVENRDTSQFIKVFVEAFDTGPFGAVRALSVPPQQGSLPVPGTYPIELGQANFDITIERPCTSSTQCFDEEYAGCGVCDAPTGAQGLCQVAPRAKAQGDECVKSCECGQGFVCRRDLEGISRCFSSGASTCNDGTPINSCSGEKYCSPYGGELESSCGGFDKIPFTAFTSESGGPAGFSDDCNCPFNQVCSGDGTCGAPNGCFTTIYGLKPGDIRTLECGLVLKNPASIIQDTSANIQLRTVFRKRLQIDDVLQFLSLEEFRRQQTTGALRPRAQAFSASDQNLQVAISYSKAPPFVEGDTALMRLAINSVGSGTVYTINPSDIVIGQPGDRIKCSLETPLRSDRGRFPQITCDVAVGDVETIDNYPFTINVYYDYEVRQSLPVQIQKV